MIYDEKQQEVIAAAGGYHVVLAPPGCGKTEILAARIVHAYHAGTAFADMLCLTFTNRASRGMRERISTMTECEGIEQLFVGNVHRFCSRFLFDNGIIPESASVIDEEDTISIIADYLEHEELSILSDNRWRHYYSTIMNFQHLMYQYAADHPRDLLLHADSVDFKALRAICTELRMPYSRSSILDIYEHIDDYYPSSDLHLTLEMQQLLQMMYAARHYEQYKRANSMLDFEDLLLFTYDAVKDELPADCHTYTWIQIDEVQDLNPLQLAIIDRFTNRSGAFSVLYLGDEQQAIFSFMGAKKETLNLLKERCRPEAIHTLGVNYRSPKYLLDVFNDFGVQVLGIDRRLLPVTDRDEPHLPADLAILKAQTQADEYVEVAALVQTLFGQSECETTAVIVSSNREADEMSLRLNDIGVPHFKVSGRDLFDLPEVKLLFAHFTVLVDEHNLMAWSRILKGLRMTPDGATARKWLREVQERALTPVDFLTPTPTYMQTFARCYAEREVVVFDTETTGLDVFADDIVQLAAIKVRNGKVVEGSSFNVFIRTEREIPAMLGDIPNPIIEEMKHHECLSPEEAFAQFMDYVADDAVLGHNVEYDFHILLYNLLRHAPQWVERWKAVERFDSLKLIRLLHPRQKSYKLKHLLERLGLEGTNSHLADDDIMATKSLADYCYRQAVACVDEQQRFIDAHRPMVEKFRHVYADLFFHSFHRLYVRHERQAFTAELRYVYDTLVETRHIAPVEKLHYIVDYLDKNVMGADEDTLIQQLHNHIRDINSYRETDLCGSKSIQERVFVSTVHKAKGLEFDNVVVLGVTDDRYPRFSSTNHRESLFEDACRLYVALSRARRRLFVSTYASSTNRYGRIFPRSLSPFMSPVEHHFVYRHNALPLSHE